MLLTTRTRAYPFSKDVWGLYGICKRKAVINENEKNLKKMIDNLSEFNQ